MVLAHFMGFTCTQQKPSGCVSFQRHMALVFINPLAFINSTSKDVEKSGKELFNWNNQ